VEDEMARGVVLTAVERGEISHGVVTGRAGRVIARRLGRNHSVVNREIAGDGGRSASRACQARQAAEVRCERPKDRRADGDPQFLAEVSKGLSLKWSPQQLRVRFDQEEAMRCSALPGQ
jgi:IS30 family transposase